MRSFEQIESEFVPRLTNAPWRRIAVVGDSIAAGIGEPTPGYPDRGWIASVVAVLAAAARPREICVKTLGRRGSVASEIRARQVEEALEFGPDLVFLSAGGNDLLRPDYAREQTIGEVDAMVAAFRTAGADVATIGLFDASGSPYLPADRKAAIRHLIADLAAGTAEVAGIRDAIHVAFTDSPIGADPSIYARDGLHLNRRGHAQAAGIALGVLTDRLERAEQA